MASNSKIINRRNAAISHVDDVVFRGISSVIERQSAGIWIGTVTNLTTALNRVLSKRQRTILPGSPGALRVVINRVVNRLRNRGIGVRFSRSSDHTRTRFVRFAR
jgi:hypothetical protein